MEKTYDASCERKWQEYWDRTGVYKYDRSKETFSIDTPPPTVSGKMHLGHSFSYSQMDFIARYHRMQGKSVLYPFGTDDNGLATERLIEKLNKVRSVDMKRSDFIRLCLATLEKIRPDFVADWKRIGMSADFTLFYSTINDHCRRISQKSFIDLHKQGRAYRKEAPTIWCPECRTAIAQVELEDLEKDSVFHEITFAPGLVIATTRPELLASFVAIFVNPTDIRYRSAVGRTVRVPLFGQDAKVIADTRANPEKGTGAVMCCTFGDQTDIEWYKAYNLPLRMSIGRDGRLTEAAGKYQGLKTKEAREQIVADLKASGLHVKETAIKHTVNVHERCGTPIEILNTRQWFIRYLDLKDDFLKAGEELAWYPDHMRHRLKNWILGLQWDWCISRQRHFGVPFPIWYCRSCGKETLADDSLLPVDPLESSPGQCECGSTDYEPEKDVLDTWATSSLTPDILAGLVGKEIGLMDLRPQAHDIVTFWLFNTLAKSRLHHQRNPWKNVMISGWALDPQGRKMSKSKGNAIEPQGMLDKYSADALRYWAAGSNLGDDLPFLEKDLVTGKKLVMKLWNASRFALSHLEGYRFERTELHPLEKWMLSKLQVAIADSTAAFERYEYSKARQATERFFWEFCDNYLEMVKDRLYNPANHSESDVQSAKFGIYEGILTILKLLAPILPHVTEEIYQSHFASQEMKRSIHISSWPDVNNGYTFPEAAAGDVAVMVISAARKHKSLQNKSQKEPIERIVVSCSADMRVLLEGFTATILATTSAKDMEFGESEEIIIEISDVAHP